MEVGTVLGQAIGLVPRYLGGLKVGEREGGEGQD